MAQWRDYFTDLTVLESCCYCGDRGGYRNGTLTGMNVKAGVPRSSTAGFALYEDATSGYLNGSIVTFVTDFAGSWRATSANTKQNRTRRISKRLAV